MSTSLPRNGEALQCTFTAVKTPLFVLPEFNRLHVTAKRLVPVLPEPDRSDGELPGLVAALRRLSGRNGVLRDVIFNQEAFRFIFYLLLPPPGLPQFQSLRRPTSFLLGELCKVPHLALSDSFVTRLNDAAELLFDLLQDFPSHEPVRQRLYPVYYLHLKSWSRTGESMRPSYRRYGLVCHLRLCRMLRRTLNSPEWRRWPRHPDKQSREYDIAVAMAAFIRFCPVELSNLIDVPFRRPSEDLLLTTFIRALYAAPEELISF